MTDGALVARCKGSIFWTHDQRNNRKWGPVLKVASVYSTTGIGSPASGVCGVLELSGRSYFRGKKNRWRQTFKDHERSPLSVVPKAS